MIRRVVVAAAAMALLFALAPAGALGESTKPPREPAPFWMTPQIQKRIDAAGTKGVSLSQIRSWVRAGLAGQSRRQQTVPEPCGPEPYEEPRVNANACQVAPYGCTANFIYHNGPEPIAPEFSDGRHHFIGTAGHCVDHANQPVYMQIFTGLVAKVGEVEKILAGDIGRNGRGNGGLGNDFAIVEIDAGFKVEPRTPIGGPQGIYTGCEPQLVKYWGHGFGVVVGPGKLEGGVATNWFDRSYGWAGVGLPGDSGSGVLIEGSNQAAGNLTHLLIDFRRYPGSNLAGTRVTRALTWMGGNYFLVNQDRTKSRVTMADTACGNADASPN